MAKKQAPRWAKDKRNVERLLDLCAEDTLWPQINGPVRIGIDPGTDGGLVALKRGWEGLLNFPMPVLPVGRGRSGMRREVHEVALLAWLRRVKASSVDVAAILERAQTRPEEGAVSAFNYGTGFGQLRMALAALGIPYELVHPLKWTNAMVPEDLRIHNKPKMAVRKYVQATMPDAGLVLPRGRVPHGGMADAAVMAQYGFRVFPPRTRLPPGPVPS